LINPDVPLSGSMWGGSVDMRTGAVSYSSYDAMYCSFAGVEFIRKWTGIQLPVGGGEYADAKEPGLYTALEKAYKAMTIAAFTGQHPSIGQGMLEEGRTISPVQLMLERDYAHGLMQLDRDIDPTPERIAMDAIKEVDVGLHANHLQSMHTAKNFRDHLWLPEFYDRSGWAGVPSEKEACDKAQAKVNELLFSYQKPEGREEQLEEMRAVVESARGDLLG
ncbi:MAG: trimethylamine methyltransferase family protein, partial [Armatimonadota bacterium]